MQAFVVLELVTLHHPLLGTAAASHSFQAANAITVPQQAVTRTQQGDTLTVVEPDGKLSKRTVKISAAQDNQWVVLEGLKAGEQVMVDGFQKLQMMPPGTPVKAVPWKAPAPAAPAAAAAAPAPAAKQ